MSSPRTALPRTYLFVPGDRPERMRKALNSGADALILDLERAEGLGIRRSLRPQQLLPYQYPAPEDFVAAGLEIVYLGWFLGDWSLVNNGLYACTEGLELRDDGVESTGDLFGLTALDEDFTPINQMIKYYKFGFGRTTDYVNEDIRLGRMSRAQGIALVAAHDHACAPAYIQRYCDYLGIGVADFWAQVRAATNRRLFDIDADGRIHRRFIVGEGLPATQPEAVAA